VPFFVYYAQRNRHISLKMAILRRKKFKKTLKFRILAQTIYEHFWAVFFLIIIYSACLQKKKARNLKNLSLNFVIFRLSILANYV
jgi:hypothetical protein